MSTNANDTIEPQRLLLVTASQLLEGYYERSGAIAIKRKFQVIDDHGDGTITVVNPKWQHSRAQREVG